REVAAGSTLFKCAPPIRDAIEREGLWNGLKTGVIDMVVTDHSPCPPVLKQLDSGDFLAAWGGIASLQLSLRAVWTGAGSRGFQLDSLVKWMCTGPAQIAGLSSRKGGIAPGL